MLPAKMLSRKKGHELEKRKVWLLLQAGKYYPLSHRAPIIAEPIYGGSFIPDPLFNLLMGQFPSKRRMIRPISISVPFSADPCSTLPYNAVDLYFY